MTSDDDRRTWTADETPPPGRPAPARARVAAIVEQAGALLAGVGIRGVVLLLGSLTAIMVIFAFVFGPDPVWATFRELIGLTPYPVRPA